MANEHQKVIQGSEERVYMEYRDEDDALVDPTNPKLSIYDNQGIAIVDDDSVTLTDVVPTKKSIGLYYWLFKPKAAEPLGVVSAWWQGTISGELVEMDQPQSIQIISEPTSGISLTRFCLPSDVRFILSSASPELNYDDELIDGFIQLADDEIKQDLYNAYDLAEFSSSVPRVKAMSQWKSAELLLRTVFAANFTTTISQWAENYKQKYEEIRDAAAAVGPGYKPILTAAGVPLTRKNLSQTKSTTENYPTTFDMRDQEDQLVDPDRLDDEALERD